MVDGDHDDIVKWCAGGLYAGAADTVSHISSSQSSSIHSFILVVTDGLGSPVLHMPHGPAPFRPNDSAGRTRYGYRAPPGSAPGRAGEVAISRGGVEGGAGVCSCRESR